MRGQNKSASLFILVLMFVFVVSIMEMVLLAEEKKSTNHPAAEVTMSSSGIHFTPRVSYGLLALTVSLPDGTQFKKSFAPGVTPYLGLSEISRNQAMDGNYTFELRVSPGTGGKVRGEEEGADLQLNSAIESQAAITQTGHFLVRSGAIVNPANIPEPNGQGIAKPEYTYNEDLYVKGRLCVGTDCSDPETWLYDVIRLKENNLRIHFNDTSATSSFPANDWRILINDIEDGGGNYFAVEDSTSDNVPFSIEAGAPDNALYIEDYGRIGLKTSTPAVEMHIVDGDSPAVRLEQDTSSGWSAQVWDMASNESNFFIRDVTNSSKIPLRIQPGTPSNTLCLKSDGRIGIGTWSPAYPMELDTTGINSCILVKRTDGASNYINATDSYANFGSTTNHPLRLVVNSAWKMRLNTDGSITMSNGASLTVGGVWTDASSRALKENIQSLTTDEAMNTLNALNPVKFNYKADKSEKHVGFIAEDAPELIAAKDKKGMSPMDVVAVLTKIVQEQQKTIAQLQERIAKLEKR